MKEKEAKHKTPSLQASSHSVSLRKFYQGLVIHVLQICQLTPSTAVHEINLKEKCKRYICYQPSLNKTWKMALLETSYREHDLETSKSVSPSHSNIQPYKSTNKPTWIFWLNNKKNLLYATTENTFLTVINEK